jgi:hypothetical protein
LKFKSKTTGIHDEDNLNGNITLFPNPSKGTVAVLYNGALIRNADLLIQNVTGQTILRKGIENLKNGQVVNLDLSSYTKGIYFIKITAPEGSHTAKVVLQ